MNVLLINPPFIVSRDNAITIANPVLPPLGLLYIAAYARKKLPHISIQILDSPAYKLNLERFKMRLNDYRPDIVGITTYTTTFSTVLVTAEAIKKTFPNCIIVVGGPHASILPEDLLASKDIDIAVMGEGEEAFVELLECINKKGDIDKVPNIAYKKDDRIVQTQAHIKIIDLDSVPLPARDLIDMKLYHPALGTYRRLPATNMIISRGCPFRCIFCSKNIFGSQYRQQSCVKTLEEIEILVKDYGIREVIFNDDVFTVDKKRTESLCDLLLQKKIDFTWSCNTRVDVIDPQLLNKMRESGCISIGYGIEAGDVNILKKVSKGFSLEKAKQAIRWTREAGIETRAFYILGFPGETRETIKRTVDVSLGLDADFVIYNIAIPFPGTEMYEEAKSAGLLLYDGVELYNQTDGPHPLIKLSDITPVELVQLYHLAYRRFYLRPKYIFNQLKRTRSISDLERNLKGFFSYLSWYR